MNYLQAIYYDGAFYLMGGYESGIQTEVWKSPVERKMLPNEHNFDRHCFSITAMPNN